MMETEPIEFETFQITPEYPLVGVCLACNTRVKFKEQLEVKIEKTQLFDGQPAYLQDHFKAIEEGPLEVDWLSPCSGGYRHDRKNETRKRGKGYHIPPAWVFAHVSLQNKTLLKTEMTSTIIMPPNNLDWEFSYVMHNVRPYWLRGRTKFSFVDPSETSHKLCDLMLCLPRRYEYHRVFYEEMPREEWVRKSEPLCSPYRPLSVKAFVRKFPALASAIFLMGEENLKKLAEKFPEGAQFDFKGRAGRPYGITLHFKEKPLERGEYDGFGKHEKDAIVHGGITMDSVDWLANAQQHSARTMYSTRASKK